MILIIFSLHRLTKPRCDQQIELFLVKMPILNIQGFAKPSILNPSETSLGFDQFFKALEVQGMEILHEIKFPTRITQPSGLDRIMHQGLYVINIFM